MEPQPHVSLRPLAFQTPDHVPVSGKRGFCNALINNGRMLTLVLGLKFCQLSFFQISDFFSRFLWRKPLLEVAALSSWTPGGEIALVRVFSSQQAGKSLKLFLLFFFYLAEMGSLLIWILLTKRMLKEKVISHKKSVFSSFSHLGLAWCFDMVFGEERKRNLFILQACKSI